jgi:hypothetical protein
MFAPKKKWRVLESTRRFFFAWGGSWERTAHDIFRSRRQTMLSVAAYGLFFTISILVVIVFILTLEKFWSKKERL